MSPRPSAPDSAVLTEVQEELEEPPLFRVILHNDDFTTMDFVVFVLQKVFQHPEARAIQLMLQVHMNGYGVAGLFPHEIAEMKVDEVHQLAETHEYPLLCTMEEA